MLRDRVAVTVGLIFVCTTLFGLSSTEAQQIDSRLLKALVIKNAPIVKSVPIVSNEPVEHLPAATEVSNSKPSVVSQKISSTQVQTDTSVKKEEPSELAGDNTDLSNSTAQALPSTAVSTPTNGAVNSSSAPIVQVATPAATSRTNVSLTSYSFQRDGIPTLEQRREIRNTPIELRPHRPFHFYGNTVRRSGRR